MDSFKDKIAVITGGGTGMGRELVRQLASSGCNVAMCDVMEENMQETLSIVSSESPEVHVSAHLCDVSLEEQVIAFKEAMIKEHETDYINLLFNNAGIGGGGSFVEGDQNEWEKTQTDEYNLLMGLSTVSVVIGLGLYLSSKDSKD